MQPIDPSVAFEGSADFDRALLQAQTEASLDGILVASADGRILSFNKRFAQMWGIPEETLENNAYDEARQMVMDQLVDPSGFIERVDFLYSQPGDETMDELRLKDGRFIERYSRPILRSQTGTYGRVWFFRDVTRARRATARLHAQYAVTRVTAEASSLEEGARELLRGIGESLSWDIAALWLIDEEDQRLHCISYWQSSDISTPVFRQRSEGLRLAKGEGLPGRAWEAGTPIWIRDMADVDTPRSKLAQAEGLRTALAFPIMIADEVVGVVDVFARTLREADEELMEAKAALGRQIGNFIARRRIEDAIRTSEARKTAILQSALDCVVTMDHRGRIVDFNPAAEATFGYKREDAIGNEMASLIIPEEFRERHWAGLKKYLETGEGPLLGKRIEVHAQRADGSLLPVELAIAPVEVPGPPVFTGYLRDITERRSAEKERVELLLNERRARADAENAQKRLAYLAEASRILGGSLDYRATLKQIARLAVPQLADWCAIYIAEGEDPTEPLALAHVDPEKVNLAERYYRKYPPDPQSESGTLHVMRTGRSEIMTEMPQELIETTMADPEQLAMATALEIKSYMIVPLKARDRTLGAITFVSSDANRLFDVHDLAFAEDVARRAAMAVDNARLYEEQAGVAQALQSSLLPPILPQMKGIDLATLYEPSGNEVGGDFYDVFPLSGDEWAVVIGDVCGKGAEAAAITGLARHTIRAVAMRESDPTKLLETLNEAMVRQPHGERFATVAMARLQWLENGAQIEVACGGHPEPLLLRRNGEVEQLGEAGTVLGLFTGIEINPRIAELEPGDLVVFYTDGVTEARSSSRIYGQYRLIKALEECVGKDARSVVDHIRASVERFRERAARDDMAIVAIRIDDGSAD